VGKILETIQKVVEPGGLAVPGEVLEAVGQYEQAVAGVFDNPDLNAHAKARKAAEARAAVEGAITRSRDRMIAAVDAEVGNAIGQAKAAIRGAVSVPDGYLSASEQAALLLRDGQRTQLMIGATADAAYLMTATDPAQIAEITEAALLAEHGPAIERVGRVALLRLRQLEAEAASKTTDPGKGIAIRIIRGRIESSLSTWADAHPTPLELLRRAEARRERRLNEIDRGLAFVRQALG
jgi:hypothetical protein